jgi:hypothetical protein
LLDDPSMLGPDCLQVGLGEDRADQCRRQRLRRFGYSG